MALHRDIFWIGRQWAVTGHGMQLIDQRLMGAFDIEVARLWDDDLIERMHAKEWLNVADFDQGLAVARTRHKQQPVGSAPVAAPAPAIESIALPPLVAKPELPELEMPKIDLDLQMKIDGGAKFARPWRVWMKKKT
ncbi:hypothetical protein [Bradyrhizobium valentinum]|uniref:hypothetical protein n=1 Tax=Bradyrhizobium valentinum TaxID=1518501 RepID=UPI0007C85959|nr:hypothetical protein [Bradyrhizobium valentinum]